MQDQEINQLKQQLKAFKEIIPQADDHLVSYPFLVS